MAVVGMDKLSRVVFQFLVCRSCLLSEQCAASAIGYCLVGLFCVICVRVLEGMMLFQDNILVQLSVFPYLRIHQH